MSKRYLLVLQLEDGSWEVLAGGDSLLDLDEASKDGCIDDPVRVIDTHTGEFLDVLDIQEAAYKHRHR